MPNATTNLDQLFQTALQHHQAGRLAEAEQLYRQILAQQARHPDALHMLGVLATQAGRNEIAVNLIRQALALAPNFPDAFYNLGNALLKIGQPDEAIAAYRQAIALTPNFPEAHNNLGVVLKKHGRLDEAIAAYKQAIAFMPNYPEADNNLGNALKEKGRLDEAIAAYRQAILLKPDFPEAHNNLGIALKENGQLDDAIAACRQAIALRPNDAEAHNNLANALKEEGRLDESIAACRQAIAVRPDSPQAYSNLLFSLNYHPGFNASAIAEEARQWNLKYAQPLRKFIQPHNNVPASDRPLKIGYVSHNFCQHVVGRALLPLIAAHDRANVHITCYAHVPCPDATTAQFQKHADCWRSVVGQSEAQIADQIRNDRIDILVDLSLHMAPNLLLPFAHKPAPVQVTWLGYPSTTGLPTIDYRLSDLYMDPPTSDASPYVEQLLRLPNTFQLYGPLASDVATNPLPAQTNGYITFGCLNSFAKINEPVLTLWAQIMQRVERSKLTLLAHPGEHQQRTRDFLAAKGITPDRIHFPTKPKESADYLRLHHQIDLCLDPFPYNGHTTSMDSFWMGVPVVSLVGQTAVARAGWSQLNNLNLLELAANTPEQYVQIATQLANDQARLAELRVTLRDRMQKSPLMNAPQFARDIEAAYRQMWTRWCLERQREGG